MEEWEGSAYERDRFSERGFDPISLAEELAGWPVERAGPEYHLYQQELEAHE